MKDLAGSCYRHHGDLLAATGDLTASQHAHEAACSNSSSAVDAPLPAGGR